MECAVFTDDRKHVYRCCSAQDAVERISALLRDTDETVAVWITRMGEHDRAHSASQGIREG